jgi:hypothetical protein
LNENDLFESSYLMMGEVNTNVLWNKFLKVLYMLFHVLSHHLDQMLNDKKLTLANNV